MSYQFFQDCECEYFPCHTIAEAQKASFNCRFCFCPLYHLADCGVNFIHAKNGVKDCSRCTKPHFDYDFIIARLIAVSEKEILNRQKE